MINHAGTVRSTNNYLDVWVDDREKSHNLRQCLQQKHQVCVSVKRLKAGDYQIGNFIVERKTIADFAQSILSGRIFSQAEALASQSGPVAIIIEVTSLDLIKLGIDRKALQGAMITISLIYKIPVLRSASAEETADLLLLASGQLTNGKAKVKPTIKHFRRSGFSKAQRIDLGILQSFPGVGLRRAQLLLKKRGTLSAIFSAKPADLKKIAGIGKTTVKKMKAVLEANNWSGE